MSLFLKIKKPEPEITSGTVQGIIRSIEDRILVSQCKATALLTLLFLQPKEGTFNK